MFWRTESKAAISLDENVLTPEAVLAAVNLATQDLALTDNVKPSIIEERPLTKTLTELKIRGFNYPATLLITATVLYTSLLAYAPYRFGRARALRNLQELLQKRERSVFRQALRQRGQQRQVESVRKGVMTVLNDLAALRSEQASLAWAVGELQRVGTERDVTEPVERQVTAALERIKEELREDKKEADLALQAIHGALDNQKLANQQQTESILEKIQFVHRELFAARNQDLAMLSEKQSELLQGFELVKSAVADQQTMLKEQGKELHEALHRKERSLAGEILAGFQRWSPSSAAGAAPPAASAVCDTAEQDQPGANKAQMSDAGVATAPLPEAGFTIASDGSHEEVDNLQALQAKIASESLEQPLTAAFGSSPGQALSQDTEPAALKKRARRGRKPQVATEQADDLSAGAEAAKMAAASEEEGRGDAEGMTPPPADDSNDGRGPRIVYSVKRQQLIMTRLHRKPFPFP